MQATCVDYVKNLNQNFQAKSCYQLTNSSISQNGQSVSEILLIARLQMLVNNFPEPIALFRSLWTFSYSCYSVLDDCK